MRIFEDVGHKVKLLAKIMFWLGSILFWWLGLTLIWESMKSSTGEGFLIGVLVAGIGTLVMYLANLMTLAFGELVEHTTRNMEISEKIYEKLVNMSNTRNGSGGCNSYVVDQKVMQNQTQQSPAQQPQTQQPQQGQSPVVPNSAPWFCTSCGTKNPSWFGACSNCGKRKDG